MTALEDTWRETQPGRSPELVEAIVATHPHEGLGTTERHPIAYTALWDAAARYAGATLRWRASMGLS